MTNIKLLDHGYVKKVEHWGSDQAIIEAARMSTDKGFLGWGPTVVAGPCRRCGGEGEDHEITFAGTHIRACPDCGGDGQRKKPGDEKLLAYLWANKHATPFEMSGLTVEVQAPIFVFRQWHRHRTQSFNEMSARYTPLPALDYVPTVDRLMASSSTNKQAGTAKGAKVLDSVGARAFRIMLQEHYAETQDLYDTALANGVPKELARLHLPVARYSRMRASANLRNWLGFLTLRLDPHAQYEIRVYAEAIGEMIRVAFPRTWELFAEGLVGAEQSR